MEKDGNIVNFEDGIDPKELEDYKLVCGPCCGCGLVSPGSVSSPQENGTIMGFPGATPTDENLLVAQCDILIPAAGEKQITSNIARQLKAKMVVEGANGPTTLPAERILQDRKVLVIPVSG